EDVGARANRFEQLDMRQLDALAVARIVPAIENESAALFEHRPPALEMSDAQLRPLQVKQDRRGPVKFLFESANMFDQLRFLRLIAVAHVDPEGVGAGDHQLADRSCIARRRAERGQDLYLARTGGESFGHRYSWTWDAMP